MSVFGKVLAFLNILAAIVFIYLATQARAMRHAWSYAAFRHELVLEGLPLDAQEKDRDGTPVVDRITSATLNQMGGVAHTLREELDSRKRELKGEIENVADDAAKRRKLEDILLLTAKTGGERDDLRERIWNPKVKVDDLLTSPDGPFEQAFAAAAPNQGRDQQRQAIGHLLVGTAEVPGDREKSEANLKRAAAALGLRDYTQAVEAHALNARGMGERVRLAILDDRGEFAGQYDLRVRQIQDLVGHLDDLKRHLHQLSDQRTENHAALVAARKKDIEDLTTELTAVVKARDEARAHQADLEKRLFTTQRLLGKANERNQQLERDIRKLELGH